jgi:serine/threonine-protein kinase
MTGSLAGGAVSHYELLGLIGKGSTGAVYKARDTRLNRLVALKFLSPALIESPEARARFESEARTIASLSHNNIGVLYDVGEDDGTPYLVLEYLGGGTLASRIRDRQLPLPEILAYARQIADGLSHAHNHGILHRDVKPGNALFAESGALKLVDFGLAHRQTRETPGEPAVQGGTPAYMAPESVLSGIVDHRCDIFAFGVLLYQLAAGRLPFSADHAEDVFRKIRQEDPPSLASIRPELPPAFIELVNQCLSKDPAGRPRSMMAVRHQLDLLDSPASPSPFPTPESPTLTAPVRKTGPITKIGRTGRRWLVACGSLAIAAAAVFLIAQLMTRTSENAGAPRCVIVPPFQCKAADEPSARFCAGLHADLIPRLSQSPQFAAGFWTVSPSEITANGIRTAAEAHKRLGADLVIQGALEQSGGEYHVRLDLTEARTLKLLRWRKVTAPGEIALAAALQRASLELLGAGLADSTPLSLSAQTRTPESYLLCVQALALLLEYDGIQKIDEAISLLDRAVAADPRNPQAHALLSQAWQQKYGEQRDPGSLRLAAESAAAAARLQPNDYQVLLALGRVQRRQREFRRAIESFTKATKVNPSDPEGFRLLALAYYDDRQERRAAEAFGEALRKNPRWWPVYHNRAENYYRKGQVENAIAEIGRVLEIAPGNANALSDLGVYYTDLGRFAEAERSFAESLQARATWRNLSAFAYLREKQKRYDEAARLFAQAAERSPSNHQAQYNLAAALHRVPGNEAAARAAWRRTAELAASYLRLKPMDASAALSRQAVAHARLGEFNLSRRTSAEALRLGGDDRRVLVKAALAAHIEGRRNETASLLERAVRAGERPAAILEDPDFSTAAADPALRRRLDAAQSKRKE